MEGSEEDGKEQTKRKLDSPGRVCLVRVCSRLRIQLGEREERIKTMKKSSIGLVPDDLNFGSIINGEKKDRRMSK